MLEAAATVVKAERVAADAPPQAAKAEPKPEAMAPEVDDGGEPDAADDEAMEQGGCEVGQAGAAVPSLEDDYDAEADDDDDDTDPAAVGQHAEAGAGKPVLLPLLAVELAPMIDVELPADEVEARRYIDRALSGFSHLLSDVPAACIIIGKDLRPASVCARITAACLLCACAPVLP